MAVTLDPLLKEILDAPVGQVESTLKKILECDVSLDIIEQNQVHDTNFVRKVTITAQDMPVIRALVKFDSKVIPDHFMTELLRKKEGIGTILREKRIKANREIVSLNFENNGKKIIRRYRIIHNSLVWFEILEEIRLDFLIACKNS